MKRKHSEYSKWLYSLKLKQKLSRLVFPVLIFLFSGCGKTDDNEKILKSGEKLFSKYGCNVCHSLEGKEIYGPPLNEIVGRQIKVIRQGNEFTIVADREYLIKAISEPRFEKVAGYQNKDMPIPVFSKKESEILADYIIEINRRNSENEKVIN